MGSSLRLGLRRLRETLDGVLDEVFSIVWGGAGSGSLETDAGVIDGTAGGTAKAGLRFKVTQGMP